MEQPSDDEERSLVATLGKMTLAALPLALAIIVIVVLALAAAAWLFLRFIDWVVSGIGN